MKSLDKDFGAAIFKGDMNGKVEPLSGEIKL